MTSHETYMRRAIELSEKAGVIEKTGGCFGAVVVDKATGEVLGEGYNHVIANCDPTWHGEMEALRNACKRVGKPHLPGCVVYTSAEPCPMCYTACMWARVDEIYYGATYQDVKEFEDADFLGELCKANDDRQVKCHQICQAEAVTVWQTYAKLPEKERPHY
ncbi:hypothetical protein N2152v2_000070 [Parachlorella kessleri]